MLEMIANLGYWVRESVIKVGYTIKITALTIVSLFRPPFLFRDVIQQCVLIGYRSLPVVALTSLFTGMITALQVGIILQSKFEAAISLMGAMIGLPVISGIGPMLTALIVTARSGSAMAAEIGSMKVTEQIDAYITLSADPIHFVLMPRFLAAVLMLPFLIAFADFVGVFGGYLVARVQFDLSPDLYLENLIDFVQVKDFMEGITKGFFYGGIIASISCSQGFSTTGGAEDVGKSTTRAVVLSSVGVLMGDFILSQISHALGLG